MNNQLTNVNNLYAIHKADKVKVESMCQFLHEKDGEYCFKPIYVRKIYDQLVIIDGVHRAKDCWLQCVDADLEYVEENELLTDEEIVMMDLIEISKV